MNKRYNGKICGTHPELGGERLKSNSRCVACHNLKRHVLSKAKYHSDPEYRSRYLGQRSVLKSKWNRYSFYTSSYRARLKMAFPSWADIGRIKDIYKEAKKAGMVVDHYYPLCGNDVCGLHVHQNLVLIPQAENDMKSNKHPADFYQERYIP